MATDTTTKKSDLSDILKKLNLTDQNQKIDRDTANKLEQYLRQPNIDFGSATDEELKNYNDALTFYKNANTGMDKESIIAEDISKFIKSNVNVQGNPYPLNDDQISKIASASARGLISGNYDPNAIYSLWTSFAHPSGGTLNFTHEIQRVFEPKIGSYEGKPGSVGNFDDTLANQGKTVQDILNTRGQVTSDQKLVQDYLAQAPQKLNQARSDFYTQQRADAQDYLKTSVIPKNLEPIERSALSTDREVAQMIANLYGGVQTSLDESESSQAISDVNFFSDAAYKTKIQDLIASRGNVQGQLNSDFNTARTTQQQGFQTAQSKLKNEFDIDLFKKQNEQALNQYQAKLKQQKDSQDAANQSNLWANVAGTGAMIGGAVITKNPAFVAGAIQSGSNVAKEVA